MPTSPANVAHPLGPPTVSGTNVTVDTLLKQPTRVTRMLLDLTLQKFIADRVFSSAGGVTGGAVLYDQVEANDLYADRDVERIAPGQDFPIVIGPRRGPKVAPVEKWGGKFPITVEARDRNDAALFVNHVRQLANTIIKKLNQRAVDTLEAEITARAGTLTVVGNSWSAAVPAGSTPTAPNATPGANLRRVQTLADIDELGIVYNIALVNPAQKETFSNFYGASNVAQVLNDNGFDEMYASNRIAAGTAYVVAQGQVGGMRVEQPLATQTYPDQAKEQDWTQSSVRPVWYIDNPFAVRKLTGIA